MKEKSQIFVDSTIYTGRPDDDRYDNENYCYDVLDALQIGYERAEHDQANTIDDCHEIERLLGHKICKNLFLCNQQKTEFYLLLLPGDKPFKTKDLSKQLGTARLSFASGEDMEKYLNIQPGSLSILGIVNDTDNHVRLVIDREVLDGDYICCHPCRNTSTLKIRTSDILEKVIPYSGHNAEVVDLE